jgi:hypothetical protein
MLGSFPLSRLQTMAGGALGDDFIDRLLAHVESTSTP